MIQRWTLSIYQRGAAYTKRRQVFHSQRREIVLVKNTLFSFLVLFLTERNMNFSCLSERRFNLYRATVFSSSTEIIHLDKGKFILIAFGAFARICILVRLRLTHRDNFPALAQCVEMIRPPLRHIHSLFPERAARIGAAHGVGVLMRQGTFNGIR